MDTLAARGIHGFIDMKKIHAAKAPLKRNITHDEVGNAALFLCSDLATGITGTILPVDAGYHIMAVSVIRNQNLNVFLREGLAIFL